MYPPVTHYDFQEKNPFNSIKLVLPGTLSADSKFNYCLKDPKSAKKDECRDGIDSQ